MGTGALSPNQLGFLSRAGHAISEYAGAFIYETRERTSFYAEAEGGLGLVAHVKDTIDGTGQKAIEVGGGAGGSGVNAGFGVTFKLFDLGPTVEGAPVTDEFSVVGGDGLGGGVHLAFLDGHVVSASISIGIEDGLSVTNTLNHSFEVKKEADPSNSDKRP